MPIYLRLQNLSWNATALDIRNLFHGLFIPEGGVHIVGGKDADAFIAFSSDDDARIAMKKDGSILCDSRITLMLSSKIEMQKVIARERSPISPVDQDSIPVGRNSGDRRIQPQLSYDPPRRVVNQKKSSYRESNSSIQKRLMKNPDWESPQSEKNIYYSKEQESPIDRRNFSPVDFSNQTDEERYYSRKRRSQYLQDYETSSQNNYTVEHDLPRKRSREVEASMWIDSSSEMTSCIRMSRFHPEVNVFDIQNFFMGIGIYLYKENIKILIDEWGEPIGQCLIECPNKKISLKAVKYSGSYLGNDKVKIAFSNYSNFKDSVEYDVSNYYGDKGSLDSQFDAYEAEAENDSRYKAQWLEDNNREQTFEETRDKVIMIKDAPYKCLNRPDIYQIFPKTRLKQVYFEYDGFGKVNGNIYAEFEEYADYINVLKKNDYMLKNKPIKLIEISNEEFLSRIKTHQEVIKKQKKAKYATVPYKEVCRSPTRPDEFIEPTSDNVTRIRVIDVSKEASIRDLIKFAMCHSPIEEFSYMLENKTSNDVYLAFAKKSDAVNFIHDFKGKKLFFGKLIDCNLVINDTIKTNKNKENSKLHEIQYFL